MKKYVRMKDKGDRLTEGEMLTFAAEHHAKHPRILLLWSVEDDGMRLLGWRKV